MNPQLDTIKTRWPNAQFLNWDSSTILIYNGTDTRGLPIHVATLNRHGNTWDIIPHEIKI